MKLLHRTLLSIVTIALLGLLATGCRTAHGFGEDMESAGEKIQRNTN